MRIEVSTYKQLIEYREAFLHPEHPLELIIKGRPGLGKSQAFTRSLGIDTKDFVLIKGNQTAFNIYRKLAEFRDLPIVIDDTDDALTDPKKRNLLKELMEHERLKSASWGSTSSQLVDSMGNALPTHFQTRAAVTIIVNDLGCVSKYLDALSSRAMVIDFRPDIYEVHRYAGGWFKDDEIYRFVGANLPLVITPDVRDFNMALKLKHNGMDWKTALLNQWLVDKRLLPVAQIMADPTLATSTARVEAYQKLTGGSRRTFMYLQAELRELRGVEQPIQPLLLSLCPVNPLGTDNRKDHALAGS